VKIYIVRGEVGWYDDRQDWNVVAYRTRELAEDHAGKLNEFSRSQENACDELRKWNEENRNRFSRRYFTAASTKLDSDFRMDGSDAPRYEVEELDLLRSVPRV
jgi:hypothetical protein